MSLRQDFDLASLSDLKGILSEGDAISNLGPCLLLMSNLRRLVGRAVKMRCFDVRSHSSSTFGSEEVAPRKVSVRGHHGTHSEGLLAQYMALRPKAGRVG